MTDTPEAADLASTPILDSDHPAVQAFAARHAVGADDRERALSLYHAVRDGFRYDPYRIDLSAKGMRASQVLANGYGWCVPKSGLLCAALRAAGIPARVGYADVRNHLSTERMRETMKTDMFIWHGYTEVWLDGHWIKCTPVFNIELCERFKLQPLEWDGRSDSLYHRFDTQGREYMEYVRQRGSFQDMPLDAINADFAIVYGTTFSQLQQPEVDFDKDVRRETGTPD